MEAKTAATLTERVGKLFLVVVVSISFLPMVGCLESSFNLADESRLPRWATLPPGVKRADVSITLNFYTSIGGDDTKVIIKGRGGKTLAEVSGKMKCHTSFASYPSYQVVVANGITEVIEHRIAGPVLYINDDPAIKKMLFAGDRACN